ncbi:cysteine dioxygenase family protein [Paraburkholderia dipogonis]|uniref:Cysteine dioxygenase family protein n=1 Tax=Paraburkholderia dipogonis TaxID=1211383 RepID=A0ABW9AZ40_9BURK
MKDDAYSLNRFITDLRHTACEGRDEHWVIATMRPLVQRFALSCSWLEPRHYQADSAQGFGVHVLHEEPDHTLAVFAVSWLPGRGIPPHDHGTWAIVGGVDGPEKNVFWERTDDRTRPGYAELRQSGERVFRPGDVLAMPSGTIHSVCNESDHVTLSLHVYGKHVNFTDRSQFDPDRRRETPFILKLA